ncbi:MAG: hypothetical protein U0R69_16735 [Gaiellales bacterium]
MEGKLGKKLVAGAVAVAALTGGGAALAASQFGADANEQAILNDAAQRLGVEPQELSEALKDAYAARIDEAIAAGRLTAEQGEAMKQRLESEGLPMFGARGHHGRPGMHRGPGLDAAATYLELAKDELRTALVSGKTLAEVAADQGKSVDGLKDAMLADAEEHLDAAVADGRVTEEQKQEILAELPDRIDDVVNGTLPAPRGHHHGERGMPTPPNGGSAPDGSIEPASF